MGEEYLEANRKNQPQFVIEGDEPLVEGGIVNGVRALRFTFSLKERRN